MPSPARCGLKSSSEPSGRSERGLFSRTVKSTAKTFAGSTFTLTADIDLGGQEWQPIGTFNGVFDGDGHTIRNLVVSRATTDDVGLFSIVKNATIKNLSVRDV